MLIARTSETPCPNCQYPLNACGNPDEPIQPVPGDFSICISCGTLLLFTEDLSLRAAEPSEIVDAAIAQPETYAELMHMQQAVLELRGERA